MALTTGGNEKTNPSAAAAQLKAWRLLGMRAAAGISHGAQTPVKHGGISGEKGGGKTQRACSMALMFRGVWRGAARMASRSKGGEKK